MKELLRNSVCTIVAGFIGGAAAQAFLSTQVVHAQTAHPAPPANTQETAPHELTAERFVMVDANGHVRGELKIEKGNPEIVLYRADGQVAWKAPMGPHVVY